MTPMRLYHRHATRHRVRPEYTPRLRLRPKGRPDAYIDGAWWPRSDDLSAELPDLLAVLAVRLGLVSRVVYDQASWPPAPRQIAVNDHPVLLDAYPFELGNTMYVHGSAGEMIVLQVISSTTDADTAHTALMAAVELPDPADPVVI
ncbi:DUF5994 family protein [Nocardia sp. NPDC049149]|uniref:DUF5994 family protein n=1 Tax=Nocardia sp. NPDC049149 TaxID=3364315 RepID=UPI00371C0A2B